MVQADKVKRVKVEDGGDGSTYIEIEFEDGSSLHFNPDVPYDMAYWEAVKQADGTLQERIIEE